MSYFNLENIDREKYKKCANRLLNECFIIKRKPSLRDDYIFILQNREYFEEQFDLLGYEMLLDEVNGIIGLRNIFGTGRLRLNKIQSILLILIRLMYLEKKTEISLNDEVVILVSELQDKYSVLNLKGKNNIDKTALRKAISLFKKYNLMATLDSEVTSPDCRIIIYPSIFFALEVANIDKLYDNLESSLKQYEYDMEGSRDEETDED